MGRLFSVAILKSCMTVGRRLQAQLNFLRLLFRLLDALFDGAQRIRTQGLGTCAFFKTKTVLNAFVSSSVDRRISGLEAYEHCSFHSGRRGLPTPGRVVVLFRNDVRHSARIDEASGNEKQTELWRVAHLSTCLGGVSLIALALALERLLGANANYILAPLSVAAYCFFVACSLSAWLNKAWDDDRTQRLVALIYLLQIMASALSVIAVVMFLLAILSKAMSWHGFFMA